MPDAPSIAPRLFLAVIVILGAVASTAGFAVIRRLARPIATTERVFTSTTTTTTTTARAGTSPTGRPGSATPPAAGGPGVSAGERGRS